ncbi:transglycosylase domain-containing protein [Xanthobacter sp. TB0139]|uniref:transglycosylase domain-containing protein n=1 Tax=Xanthobacter sp. TB0139 TaxID=3459178 RepID=UPI004039AC44
MVVQGQDHGQDHEQDDAPEGGRKRGFAARLRSAARHEPSLKPHREHAHQGMGREPTFTAAQAEEPDMPTSPFDIRLNPEDRSASRLPRQKPSRKAPRRQQPPLRREPAMGGNVEPQTSSMRDHPDWDGTTPHGQRAPQFFKAGTRENQPRSLTPDDLDLDLSQDEIRAAGSSARPRKTLTAERPAPPAERPARRPRKTGGGSGNGSGRGRGGDGGRGTGKTAKGAGKRPRKRRSLFWGLVKWGFIFAFWAAIGVAGLVAYEASKLPPMQTLMIPKRPPTVTIQGEDGKILAVRGDMGGVAVPISELPPYLPKAFVAIEDQRFYSHFGLDPEGLARAIFTNLTSRRVRQGGSTLTQQLAKNLFLTQERTFSRKVQEVILALWLEANYSKQQILDLYLNRVYFGAGAYGVEAASQRYFGKSARQVTLSEAAMLAGLVNSPSRLAPTRNLKGAQARAALVLKVMEQQGRISEETLKTALAHPATLAKAKTPDSIGYVADWVMDQLDSYVGPISGDVTVRTTIDPTLQRTAQSALSGVLDKSGAKYRVGQGALVSMDPHGAVRALVGGRSYEDSQYNRAVTARRQPGSAFKPFIYLSALEAGLVPESVMEDAPLQLKGWKPENASHRYLGAVTLQNALALSLNTVAVRLTLDLGPETVVKTAHRLGITSPLAPNPSIALGTSEVSVLELASAYVPFSNGGIGVIPHIIDTVTGPDGKILYHRQGTGPGRVMDVHYAAMMNHMLAETLVTGTGKRASLPGWEAAGKTGTSQSYRDAWFVGYTAHLVTAVWLGNDDSSPTKRASGSNLPAEIWSRYMQTAHKNVPVAELPGGSRTAGFGGIGYGEPGGSLLPPGTMPEDQPSSLFGELVEGAQPPAPRQQQPQPARGGQQANTIEGWLNNFFGGGG